MSAARMKVPAIVATILGSSLALLSWSQTWFELRLTDAATQGAGEAIAVPGSVASPALAALALAGLALAAALAIAGPAMRVVLALLEVLLGGCLLLASFLTLGSPHAAVAPAVTDATGVTGAAPTAELVSTVTAGAWPLVAIVGGAFLVLGGLVVLVTGSRWPSSSRRYRGARLSDGEALPGGAGEREASDRAIDDWDELSRGEDPTDGPGLGDDGGRGGAGGEDPADPSR